MTPVGREDWRALGERYLFTTAKRLPLTLVRGQGVRVWDEEGREYLDFVAGIAVNSLGHCHPAVVQALTEQAQSLIQVSGFFYTIPQVELAQLLAEQSGLDRVFFCNSGAEAVEGAIKLARKWGKERRNGAYEIICTQNAFHGRTLAAVTAGGTEKYKAPFTPLPPGFVHVPFNDVEAIRRATTDRTVAVLLEPVQGEGGVNVPDDDYLMKVRAWCDEAGLLLILDEVQVGIGRLGALFAFQLYGARPDILALAKGLGSGVPIGAFLAREHCAVFTPGDHGTTFGGNPLCTRVALAVLRYILDHDLPAQVAAKGEYLKAKLLALMDKHPFITQVRGRGLLWAIEFEREVAEEAVLACLREGLLVNNVKPNALRLMPPLIVSYEELDQAVTIIDRVLTQLRGG